MAEIKQGLNYEITANDKSSAVVNKAAETAKKAAKDTEDSSKKAGEAFKGEFNPMSAVLAGISGNTEALAQQMLGLASRMKKIHMTMMKFSIYAALIMACVKAVGALIEHWGKARIAAGEMKLDKTEKSLKNLEKAQAEWNKELDRTIEKNARIKDNLLAELSATEKLTNARREYAKQLELSLAKTEAEKSAIERKYDRIGDQESAQNKLISIQAERAELKENIKQWREARSRYNKENKTLKKNYDSDMSVAREAYGRMADDTWYWHWGNDDDYRQVKRAVSSAKKQKEKLKSNQDALYNLRVKIDQAKKRLGVLDIDEKTARESLKIEVVKSDIADQDAAKTEAEAKKKADEEAKSKADAELKAIKAKKEAEEKAAAEHDKAMRKAAEDEAKAIKAARLKADKEVMAERKRRLTELTTMESDAAKRLAAAQSKVAEAWAWYRDKDKMAAQLKEEKAEEAAQKQFEKDFEDLKWRRDWRTAKDLSVDQEAVRRVALAKEEETAAQKALAETAKSTAQAAASLAEIEKVITQEG